MHFFGHQNHPHTQIFTRKKLVIRMLNKHFCLTFYSTKNQKCALYFENISLQHPKQLQESGPAERAYGPFPFGAIATMAR